MTARIPGQDNWITVAEAAEIAQVHTRTIHEWMNKGAITRYRVGARWVRIDRDELLAAMQPVPVPARSA